VDKDFNGTKGGGGALFFKIIVANASNKVIWVVDSIKPESEMEKIKCFKTLPQNLTYKDITPKLFEYAENNFPSILSA